MAFADSMSLKALLALLLLIALAYIVNFLIVLYQKRAKIYGLPSPPYNRVLGHLPIMAELMATLPLNCHPHVLIHYLQEKYKLPDIFYLDTWPFGIQICAIVDPDIAFEVTVKNSLPKHLVLLHAIAPVAGWESLISIEGAQHKKWRNVFNPGFSNTHLMTLVGGIVDDCLLFTNQLAKHAEAQDIFQLEEVATRVTVDVIGRVVLDVSMNAQTSENDFVSAFRNQIKWLPVANEFNPLKIYHPLRPFVIKYNERRMDRYLMKVLNDRFAKRSSEPKNEKEKRARPIIDLALDTFLEEGGLTSDNRINEKAFQKSVLDHIKVFMFAGHDTTSSTICYAAYALSRNPSCQAKFREECDSVFGSDTTLTASKIREDPHIINRLPYAVAIIKEVLRLWPAASSVRNGLPGLFLHHDGKTLPTEDMMVWPVVYALHHSAKFWPRPTEFLPERWLAPPDSPLAPVKGAWRAFEHGPRNCIGQELAMIETRIAMVLMLRDFRIEDAYDEMDEREGRKGVRKLPDGERAYQMLAGSAKPVGGMPCRIRRE